MNKYQEVKKKIGWTVAILLGTINILLLQGNFIENTQHVIAKFLQTLV